MITSVKCLFLGPDRPEYKTTRRCDSRVSHTSYSELLSVLSRPGLVPVGIYQQDEPIDEKSYDTLQDNYRITVHYKTSVVSPDWFQ
jgi:hypothetical protein